MSILVRRAKFRFVIYPSYLKQQTPDRHETILMQIKHSDVSITFGVFHIIS